MSYVVKTIEIARDTLLIAMFFITVWAVIKTVGPQVIAIFSESIQVH